MKQKTFKKVVEWKGGDKDLVGLTIFLSIYTIVFTIFGFLAKNFELLIVQAIITLIFFLAIIITYFPKRKVRYVEVKK